MQLIISAIFSSAGKNISIANYDKVISISVPKTVIVLTNESLPSLIIKHSGIAKRDESISFDGGLLLARLGGACLFNSRIISIKNASPEKAIKRLKNVKILSRRSVANGWRTAE